MGLPPRGQRLPVFDGRAKAHRAGDIGRSGLLHGKKGGVLRRDRLHHSPAKDGMGHGLPAIEKPRSKGTAQFMPRADIPVAAQGRHIDFTMTDSLRPIHKDPDPPAMGKGDDLLKGRYCAEHIGALGDGQNLNILRQKALQGCQIQISIRQDGADPKGPPVRRHSCCHGTKLE